MLNQKKNEIDEETKKNMTTMLRLFYDATDWRIIAKRRSKFDIFSQKIIVASNQENIPRFIDKMLYELSLPCVKMPTEIVEQLDSKRDVVLETLQKEVNYYVGLATEWR